MADILPFPDRGPDDAHAQPRDLQCERRLQTLRVLLVEDDSVDADLMNWALGRIGVEIRHVVVVKSVREAFAALEETEFDLHVVDFWVGAETSQDLIASLLDRPEPRPVLVVSNLTAEEMAEVHRPSSRLQTMCKGQIETEALRRVVLELVSGGPADRLPQPASLGPELILATLREIKAIAARSSAQLNVAESRLSDGAAEAAHSAVLTAVSQGAALVTRIEMLEKLLEARFRVRP